MYPAAWHSCHVYKKVIGSICKMWVIGNMWNHWEGREHGYRWMMEGI